MAPTIHQPPSPWSLAESQHGVVSRAQLLAAGVTAGAIKHRLHRGRLHRIRPGVYAVGRPQLSRPGHWMAALLGCGPHAVLSHYSAAALLGIAAERGIIDITVPPHVCRNGTGVVVHRRMLDCDEVVRRKGLAATDAARTLLDMAPGASRADLEAAINEADSLDLIDPDSLRAKLYRYAGRPGVAKIRAVLDRHTFVLTDSVLERRFMRIVRKLGLPTPEKCEVNGFRVDFIWPALGLVVETDGLRYHRTPAAQARDLRRDQTHWAAGMTPLRFSHSQIRYEAPWVETCLADTVKQLKDRGSHRGHDPSSGAAGNGGARGQVATVSVPSSSEIATSIE
jgi:very-short-patch-repair endonuclease